MLSVCGQRVATLARSSCSEAAPSGPQMAIEMEGSLCSSAPGQVGGSYPSRDPQGCSNCVEDFFSPECLGRGPSCLALPFSALYPEAQSRASPVRLGGVRSHRPPRRGAVHWRAPRGLAILSVVGEAGGQQAQRKRQCPLTPLSSNPPPKCHLPCLLSPHHQDGQQVLSTPHLNWERPLPFLHGQRTKQSILHSPSPAQPVLWEEGTTNRAAPPPSGEEAAPRVPPGQPPDPTLGLSTPPGVLTCSRGTDSTLLQADRLPCPL